MSDTSNSKIKAISFNLDNEIEAFMYGYASQLKERKQSFSGLVKHLLMAYLINIGNPPPGIQGIHQGRKGGSEGENEVEKKQVPPTSGISVGMPYSFSDE